MSLPDEGDVEEWVQRRLEALDAAPSAKGWRHRALGMTRAEAIATAGREVRLDVRIPVGEMRVVKMVCAQAGMGTRTYLRRALGEAMVADGADPALIPYLLSDGPLR